MKLNLTSPELSLNRQIFYVEQGGYDTHQDQITDQADQLAELSQAMNAFYAATLELGIADRVVTFTLSDFGRTLEPSGDQGSVGTDHGWGSHQFVMGGAVAGGNFYGNPGGNGQIFPELIIGGADDISHGRPRPLDPDDLGRAVRRDARPLVRRLGARPADGLSEHRQLPGGTARLPHARLELLSG